MLVNAVASTAFCVISYNTYLQHLSFLSHLLCLFFLFFAGVARVVGITGVTRIKRVAKPRFAPPRSVVESFVSLFHECDAFPEGAGDEAPTSHKQSETPVDGADAASMVDGSYGVASNLLGREDCGIFLAGG